MAFDEVQTEDVVWISGFWDLEVLTVYIELRVKTYHTCRYSRIQETDTWPVNLTNFEIWPETPSNPHLQTTETPSNLHLQMFPTRGQLRNLAGDNLESGKHPGDLSRGHAFLWTAPSQRVYCFITYLYYH